MLRGECLAQFGGVRDEPPGSGVRLQASVLIELLMPRAQSITAGASRDSASAGVQRLVGATT
jgi:hypothetical protein